jgi:hypothetical protein
VADTKISALTAVTTLTGASELPVNEGGTSKKATITQVVNSLDVIGQSAVKHLGSDHSVSSATATEVTDLSITLVAGSYAFKYFLILQSSATGTGIGLGLNYTGTATRIAAIRYNVTSATTTTTGVATGSINTLTGNMVEGWATIAESTSTASMLNTGVVTGGADIYVTVEGVLVVSNGGDLELWHGSEGAVATTVESGSSLVIWRTA